MQQEQKLKQDLNGLVSPFNERGIIKEIATSRPYLILKKLCKGEKINQKEKEEITREINTNTYFKDSVALMGVRICFKPFLKRYWFKSRWGNIYEQYAFNKTSLRENNKYLYPLKILEVAG